MPSGPVVRASAAMAFATASSAGAAATASWFESPRQISPSREIAALARSMRSASASETTTPKSRTSWVAWRSVAVSMPRHGDRALLAEELAGDRGALGHGHEVGDRLVDAADPLVERQREQLGRPRARAGRAPPPRARRRRPPGSAGGSGPWSPARCRTSRRRQARPRAPAPGSRRPWCRATARASPGRRPLRGRSGPSRCRSRPPRRSRPRSRSSPAPRRRRAGRWPPPSRARAGRSRGCRPRRRPRARRAPRGRRRRRAGR